MSLENSNANQPINPQSVSSPYTVLSAGVGVQLLAPASNVNGVIIHSAKLCLTNQAFMSLIARATAPTFVTDSRVIETSSYNLATIGAGTTVVEIKRPITIPAGLGIYLIADSTGTAFGNVQYTVL